MRLCCWPPPNLDPETIHSSRHNNVVVFGEGGAGKSSLINVICGDSVARTGNDVDIVTTRVSEYPALINGENFRLWDTPGSHSHNEFVSVMDKVLRRLSPTGSGINLVIYCMRGERVRGDQRLNIRHVHETLCRPARIPMVLVVTGLEYRLGATDSWWEGNQASISQKLGIEFNDHACVSTLPPEHGASSGVHSYENSQTLLRRLVHVHASYNMKRTSTYVSD
ncbi:hypothetical protein HYDPIDRAFT_108362 [Hydnomerulius pinastri MD-312]|nr:hypothetical protein HYDPIDRAFT_108362 [Hydnomerulius pinastri MD-312]